MFYLTPLENFNFILLLTLTLILTYKATFNYAVMETYHKIRFRLSFWLKYRNQRHPSTLFTQGSTWKRKFILPDYNTCHQKYLKTTYLLYKINSILSHLILFLKFAPVGAIKNWTCAQLRAPVRGIGNSFQLAITTLRINLISYGIATAQSWKLFGWNYLIKRW